MTSSTFDRRLLAFIAFVFVALSIYALRTADADLWGHLTYGRHVLERGGPTAHDPFAFTTTQQRWHDHEYLAQVSFWIAYREWGSFGLILLKSLLGVGVFLCVYRTLRLASDDARIWAPVLVLLAVGISHWFLFRPQLYTFLFFSLYVWLLFRYLIRGASPLWVLVAVMPLWVNLHGGFLAGIGAIGLVGLLRVVQLYNQHGLDLRTLFLGSRSLGVILLLTFVASFLNPMGWRLWPYLSTELGFAVNRVYIDEWRPIWNTDHYWAVGVMLFTGTALLVVTALAQTRRVMIAGLHPWQWLLGCVPLTYMACQSIRHIPIWTLWIGPVLVLHAEASARAWSERSVWRLTWFSFVLGTSIPALLTLAYVFRNPEPSISLAGPVLGARKALSGQRVSEEREHPRKTVQSALVGLVLHVEALPRHFSLSRWPQCDRLLSRGSDEELRVLPLRSWGCGDASTCRSRIPRRAHRRSDPPLDSWGFSVVHSSRGHTSSAVREKRCGCSYARSDHARKQPIRRVHSPEVVPLIFTRRPSTFNRPSANS